ncbi:uncharacterized protein LOC128214411 [Mya arenaria]|uniref:uncharacterized protein LOC128214411 n=1 Tax=Mya arenaria TaxID=6604 RepID=UPI0022E4D4A1|nr:uncharacterized protein LOC128214411 [Mya arenaria]
MQKGLSTAPQVTTTTSEQPIRLTTLRLHYPGNSLNETTVDETARHDQSDDNERLQQIRAQRERKLPPEPSTGLHIRFIFPNGNERTRRFDINCPIQDLVNFAGSHPNASEELIIQSAIGTKVTTSSNGTLQEYNFVSNTTVHVRWIPQTNNNVDNQTTDKVVAEMPPDIYPKEQSNGLEKDFLISEEYDIIYKVLKEIEIFKQEDPSSFILQQTNSNNNASRLFSSKLNTSMHISNGSFEHKTRKGSVTCCIQGQQVFVSAPNMLDGEPTMSTVKDCLDVAPQNPRIISKVNEGQIRGEEYAERITNKQPLQRVKWLKQNEGIYIQKFFKRKEETWFESILNLFEGSIIVTTTNHYSDEDSKTTKMIRKEQIGDETYEKSITNKHVWIFLMNY